MKKMLIRADDLGYSKAVNYGIFESIHSGIINNVGVMVNMEATSHGLNLIKKENVDLGLHTVICAGRPLTNPKDISSIVDERGFFKNSSTYRSANKDFVNLDEVMIEIEAQYQRFIQLIGRKPDYFEGHAVASQNFVKGMKMIAKKHKTPYLPFAFGTKVTFKNTTLMPVMESMEENYQPQATFLKAVSLSSESSENIPMMICHPGYLDEYILEHSSLKIPRVKEVEMLCAAETKEACQKQKIKLIRYSELT